MFERPWVSQRGLNMALSRREQGFESPRGHHLSLAVSAIRRSEAIRQRRSHVRIPSGEDGEAVNKPALFLFFAALLGAAPAYAHKPTFGTGAYGSAGSAFP